MLVIVWLGWISTQRLRNKLPRPEQTGRTGFISSVRLLMHMTRIKLFNPFASWPYLRGQLNASAAFN